MSSSKDRGSGPNSPGRLLVWILLLVLGALVMRAVVCFVLFKNFRDDPDAYRLIAGNVVRSGVFGRQQPGDSEPLPTAYRPPLYPLLLAATSGGQAEIPSRQVAGLQILLGTGCVWLAYLLARRMNLGGWSPVAALFVAMDPILLRQTTLVMTETLATFLSIASLWLLARSQATQRAWDAAAAGVVVGLAILCRPTFLPWSLVVVALMALQGGAWQSRFMRCAAFAVCMAAVLMPWIVRNQRLFGKPIATTTHGGYTLLLGNNASYYDWVVSGKPIAEWDARSLKSHEFAGVTTTHTPHDELTYDAACYDQARQTIYERPAVFSYLTIYRISQLWSPLPNVTKADASSLRRKLRYPIAVWYVIILSLALAAAICGWRDLVSFGATVGNSQPHTVKAVLRLLHSPWVYGLAMCVVFTAIHSIYWSNLRMRAPLMPFIACAAAEGVRLLWRRWQPAPLA